MVNKEMRNVLWQVAFKTVKRNESRSEVKVSSISKYEPLLDNYWLIKMKSRNSLKILVKAGVLLQN